MPCASSQAMTAGISRRRACCRRVMPSAERPRGSAPASRRPSAFRSTQVEKAGELPALVAHVNARAGRQQLLLKLRPADW